jgi:hypothetical protein
MIPSSKNPGIRVPYKHSISVLGNCELFDISVMVYLKDAYWITLSYDQRTTLQIRIMLNYRKQESVWILHQR